MNLHRLVIVLLFAHASSACVGTSPHGRSGSSDEACVQIPSVSERVIVTTRAPPRPGEAPSRTITWQLETTRLFDVDGDGQLDAFVPMLDETGCPERALYRVFVVRGACGHEIGTVGPGTPEISAGPINDSYAVITTVSETSISGAKPTATLRRTSRVWRVAAGQYRASEHRTVDSECYHCPTWSCQRLDEAP